MIGFGLGYALLIRSSEQPAVHGLAVPLDLVFSPGIRLLFRYVLRQPVVARGASGSIEISDHPLTAGIGYYRAIGNVGLGFSGSFTAGYWRQTVRRVDSATAVSKNNDDWVFSVAPMLDLDYRLTDWLAIYLSLGAEFAINGVRYVERLDGQSEVLMDQWPVQPDWLVGLKGWLF